MVFAEGGVIQISPSTKNIYLDPGASYSDNLLVQNIGDEALDFVINVSPYQVKDGTYDPIYSINNEWTKIVEWVSVPTETFHLEPKDSVEVPYSINVPTDVAAGAQYVVISAVSNKTSTSGETVKVISSVGMLVYAEISGETRVDGEVLSKEIKGFLLKPPITVDFSLSNTGNINSIAECSMVVTNFFSGSEAYSNKDDPKKIVVMPDTVRDNTLSWESSPFLGIFRVNVSLTYLSETFNVSKIVILCPLWFIVLTIVFITMAVMMAVFSYKKRHQSYSRNKGFGF